MSQSFYYKFNYPSQQPKQDRAMTNEQFEQIVEAILAGKYSWACVLILRFAGYNPLHYIPYRTYNRLLKDNCLNNQPSSGISHPTADAREHSNPQTQLKRMTNSPDDNQSVDLSSLNQTSKKIEDLDYLKDLDSQCKNVRGGSFHRFF